MAILTLKKYAKYSAKVFAFVAVAGLFVYCAGGWDESDFVSSFFAPEVSHQQARSPLYRSLQVYYHRDNSLFDQSDFTDANVEEWKTFFDNKVSSPDIHALLYMDSDTKYIDTLIFFTRSNKFPISNYLRKLSINTYPDAAKKLEFLYYLGFAKRCEPYVTKPNEIAPWGVQRALDPEPVNARKKLIESGPKVIATFKNPFVRQRAHFQMLRLLYLNDQFQACADYFEANRKEIEEGGTALMKCRAMSYTATAMYKLKRNAEASYLFSIIYDQVPSMQKTAFFYFNPQEEKDWNKCLALAKTPHEKCVLWLMNGVSHKDELRSIKEIYKMEPSSEVLDLLLVRLMNVCEEPYVSLKYNLTTGIWGVRDSSRLGAFEASEFINTVLDDTRLHNRPLWHLCQGYLYQMQSKYRDANKCYDKACAMAPRDTLLNQQAHLLRIMCNAELIGTLDLKRENEILVDLKWLSEKKDTALRTQSAYTAIRTIISRLYAKQHNPVMAELANGFVDRSSVNWEQRDLSDSVLYVSDQFYRSDSNTYKMIAFMDRPGKTPMEQYLVSAYERKKDDLVFLLGLKDVYNDHLADAIKKWKSISNNNGGIQADPFLIHIRDCHDCDIDKYKSAKYGRLSVVEEMVALEQKANAESYFKLANVFYNITYFGNNRSFYSNNMFSIGSYDVMDWNGKKVGKKLIPDVANCSLALKYYLMARDASSDKEFKAKCTYMAAKCEHNMSDETYADGDGMSPAAHFGTYFKQLKENYADTKYNKEVLRECSYFRYYVKMNR